MKDTSEFIIILTHLTAVYIRELRRNNSKAPAADVASLSSDERLLRTVEAIRSLVGCY